jgi:hypothetical protein
VGRFVVVAGCTALAAWIGLTWSLDPAELAAGAVVAAAVGVITGVARAAGVGDPAPVLALVGAAPRLAWTALRDTARVVPVALGPRRSPPPGRYVDVALPDASDATAAREAVRRSVGATSVVTAVEPGVLRVHVLGTWELDR